MKKLLVVGTGIDIIEIERISKAIEKNIKFLERFFTLQENLYFESRKNSCQVIAGNFAAKEAFVKAIGIGIRKFSLKDIEVLRDKLGKPYIRLYRKALEITQQMNIDAIHISISHCRAYAVATVITEDSQKV